MRIEDIVTAIDSIQTYTKGMEFEGFIADIMALDAVIRNLVIIGEAARCVPKTIQKQYAQIPWDEMRRMGDILVERYWDFDVSIIWKTIQEDLPLLMPEFDAMLKESRRQPETKRDQGSST